MRLAQACDLPLNVFWYSDNLHNCSFSNLFVRPAEFSRLIESSELNLIGRGIKSFYERVLKYTCTLHIPPERRPNPIPFEEFATHQATWIESYLPFFSSEPQYDFLSPNDHLRKVIEQVCRLFKGRVVGVHVRRTDNDSAKENSPTRAFVRIMEEELAEFSDTRFFLATDSPEEEQLLQHQFKDRIVVYPKRTLARARKEGIQDAVTDLFCLSRTEKIIGSCGSSFTETASRISNIPLVIAQG
jgi:hypothetical protein